VSWPRPLGGQGPRIAGAWLLALSLAACGRGAATALSAEGGTEVARTAAPPAPEPADPILDELWDRAGEGELVDLARLYDREGETGLVEGASLPAHRMTAIAALRCGADFSALPFLAEVASSGTEDEARVALESASSLAAVPQRARDPEDALELRRGCDQLAALARKADAPSARRSRAVSVLRMLTATGCITPEAIPTDLDPK
jgi:hypothetical protein